jgi:hypothetical protein
MQPLLTILLPTPLRPAPPPPPTTNRDESRGSNAHAHTGYDNVAFAEDISGAIEDRQCVFYATDKASKKLLQTQKLAKGISQGDTVGELCLAPAIKKPRPPNDANRRKQISCSLPQCTCFN